MKHLCTQWTIQTLARDLTERLILDVCAHACVLLLHQVCTKMGLWLWIQDPNWVAKSKKETNWNFCPWNYLLWAVEWSAMESGRWSTSDSKSTSIKTNDNSSSLILLFVDDPYVPKLWPRSEIHPFHPWRQGHTVLGRMVWNPCHRKLGWDMSSSGHISLWDSAAFIVLPIKSYLPCNV